MLRRRLFPCFLLLVPFAIACGGDDGAEPEPNVNGRAGAGGGGNKGGAAGSFVAYSLANAGCRVVLLEADRVGQGATARADGVLVPGPGPGFRDLWDRLGDFFSALFGN